MSISGELSAAGERVGLIRKLAPVTFMLAVRNLVHDKTRLTATIVGLSFAVILIGVQLGICMGVRKIITNMVDHTNAQLWIVPFGTQSIEGFFPILGAHERRQALGISGVQRVIPLVAGFSDWDRPDRGITHVVIVGLDAEDGGLAPWNLRSGDWTDIKSSNGVGVDRTYLSELGVSGIGSRAAIEFGINSRTVDVKALTQGIRSLPRRHTSSQRPPEHGRSLGCQETKARSFWSKLNRGPT